MLNKYLLIIRILPSSVCLRLHRVKGLASSLEHATFGSESADLSANDKERQESSRSGHYPVLEKIHLFEKILTFPAA